MEENLEVHRVGRGRPRLIGRLNRRLRVLASSATYLADCRTALAMGTKRAAQVPSSPSPSRRGSS